ncbi:hypothetical protein KUCAC02_028919 [Chaenocephalus aceratus]|uniref:Uncharacterized protein n=1 Tax=Chaenocephalus aceratus TaxID=36190 RepID=A0ACB9X3G0_CHAAC|nr:hypothetical protein KUCAC02_028919 [Chaenocephalus aceratus]
MPNLQILNLESNKLSSVPVQAVAAWTSLTTVSLAGNAWDCSPSICPLMGWLMNIREAKDISMICSSPKSVQGATPNTMRQLQQHSVNHKRRKKAHKQEQDLNSQLQEYYLSYHSNSETMDSLVNESRPCTCTISGSIECEV